ncbi:hypothetical protein C7S13_7245 [Burkholderia cepacia]|nr:hypothetical protein [Burkholderia cepacia]
MPAAHRFAPVATEPEIARLGFFISISSPIKISGLTGNM